MLLGFVLLYVGAVLFLNGLWLFGKIEDREILVINVVSGVVTFAVSLAWAFGPSADAASIKGAALTILFSTTYFWVAYNRVVNRARSVRVGSARFNGRPSADGLSVDGVVLLEVQDDNQQTVTRELVLRAQFAWLGGQPALLRLNAGETSR